MCQCVFNSSLHKSINDLLIFELDLLFGRVYIDVYLRRIKLNINNITREAVFSDQSFKSRIDRMIEVSAFDEAVVDKEILVATRLARCFRFTHKTVNVHVIRLL